MTEIIINGTKWRRCGFCDRWTDSVICKCFFDNELSKFFNKMRSKNEHIIIVTPYGNERIGMSHLGNVDKFLNVWNKNGR